MLHLLQSIVGGIVIYLILDEWQMGVSPLAASVVGTAAAYVLTKAMFGLRYGIRLGPAELDQYGRRHRYWQIRYPSGHWHR